MPNGSALSPGSQTGQLLLMRIPHGGSIIHDGPNHARVVVAVCLDRYQAAVEVAVHEGIGFVGLCICSLNVCTPVSLFP